MAEQVAVIYCGVNGLLESVPVDKVDEFEELFIQLIKGKYQKEVLDEISAGRLTDKVTDLITQCAKEISASIPPEGSERRAESDSHRG